jgi:PAS domain S-box-containing protein
LSRFTLALGVALLVVEASVAVAIIATSGQEESPWATIGLAVTAGVAFVVSGLIALMRRPENRTGVYLAATGYVWFLAALSDSDNEWMFTVGWVVGNLVWVPFTALVLAYPTGRLQTTLERRLPLAVAVLLTVPSFLTLLFDPSPAPDRCDGCPGSAIVVADLPGLGAFFNFLVTLFGLGLIVTVVAILVRRWRSASQALRRLLRPVIGAGVATLVSIGLVVIADLVSSTAADAFQLLFFLSFSAVPVAFLFGILQSRLARSSAADLVVALEHGTPLRDALAEALGDPSLEISYRPAGMDRWVDAEGRSVPEPVPTEGRAQTIVEHAGLPIAVLDYEAQLADQRELIDAVAAAASLRIQNERLYAGVRAQYTFLETMTDTAPSLLVHVDTDGRILNQNRAAVAVAGVDDQELIRGRYFWDVFISPIERDDVIARFRALAPDFAPAEYENTFTNELGERRVIYWRSAPVHDDGGTTVSIIAGGLDITERVRIAEEKEREREFLNAIANNAPSLLCLIDQRGRVADRATNLAFERMLEVSTDEAGGHVFWERYVDPAESAEVEQRIRRVIAGEILPEHDNQWVTRSGRRLLIAWTCTPLPQIDERTLFLLSGVDVTERKERELELQRERDVQTTVFEWMPSVIVVLALDGTIRDRNADDPRVGANRAFQRAIRWPDKELVGRPFLDLLVDDPDGQAARAIATAAAGSTSEQVESELRSADGSSRAFAWSATPIADVTGRMDRLILVSGVDVTERQRREEEVRAGEERLRAVIEGAPVAIMEVGLDDRVRLWNPAAELILGWSAEEVVGRVFPNVPPERETEARALLERIHGGETFVGLETQAMRRDGTRIDVEISVVPMRDAAGAVVGHMTVLSDIGDRKRHDAELRASRARIVHAADEARRTLERNLHDGAQQRLVALSVGLRLVESKLHEDPGAAATILDSAREELAHALEELRELARGIHPAVLTDRGLAPAVDALVARAPIPVEVDVQPGRLPPAVEAASYYVVAEALTNVAKYSNASGASVEVTREEGRVVVQITDDGTGGADPARGSGLRGLADRVAALDGVLSVESAVGRGTRVRAEIPVPDAVAEK